MLYTSLVVYGTVPTGYFAVLTVQTNVAVVSQSFQLTAPSGNVSTDYTNSYNLLVFYGMGLLPQPVLESAAVICAHLQEVGQGRFRFNWVG